MASQFSFSATRQAGTQGSTSPTAARKEQSATQLTSMQQQLSQANPAFFPRSLNRKMREETTRTCQCTRRFDRRLYRRMERKYLSSSIIRTSRSTITCSSSRTGQLLPRTFSAILSLSRVPGQFQIPRTLKGVLKVTITNRTGFWGQRRALGARTGHTVMLTHGRLPRLAANRKVQK